MTLVEEWKALVWVKKFSTWPGFDPQAHVVWSGGVGTSPSSQHK